MNIVASILLIATAGEIGRSDVPVAPGAKGGAAPAVPLPNAIGAEWGTIRGQVKLEGEPPALRYLARRGDPIYYRGTKNRNQPPPKQAGSYDNNVLDLSLVVDKATHGVGGVFVYLGKRPRFVHPDMDVVPKTGIDVAYRNWRFEPRNLIARTGQPVRVSPESADTSPREGYTIQVRTLPIENPPAAMLVGANGEQGEFEQRFERPERLPFRVENQFGRELTRAEIGAVGRWLVLDHPYGTITSLDGTFEIPNLPEGAHELIFWHERAGRFLKQVVTVRGDQVTELDPITVPLNRFNRPAQ